MMVNNEYEWEIELDHMVAQLHWVLENLDEIPKRTDVRHTLQNVHSRIKEMAQLCKGEDK